MKKPISKKTLTLIILVMFSFTVVNSQIIYTDINDTTIEASVFMQPKSFSIDINNDGLDDIQFKSVKGKGNLSCITPGCSASITPSVDSTSYIGDSIGINKLSVNTSINSNSIWSNQFLIIRSKSFAGPVCLVNYSGNWTNSSDGYVGVQVIANNLINYGWVRISVSLGTNASITIKDFAYNSIPNQPILAGDTGLGTTGIVNDILSTSINLFPNPAINNLTIALPSTSKKVEITIADISGKIIYSNTAANTQKIEVNTIDFAAGIYLIKIEMIDSYKIDKFIVQK